MKTEAEQIKAQKRNNEITSTIEFKLIEREKGA